MLHCITQLILNVIHLLCKNLTSIMKITIVQFKILQKVDAVEYYIGKKKLMRCRYTLSSLSACWKYSCIGVY